MGSTGVITDQSAKDYVTEFMHTNIHPGEEVVAYNFASTGDGKYSWPTVGYFAVRHTNDTVTCFVILCQKNRGEVIYKDMHESVGPTEARGITRKVYDALTPTDSEYARQWRERAWAGIEHRSRLAKFKRSIKGKATTVKLRHPLNYGEHGEINEVYIDENGNWRFPDPDNRHYRLQKTWDLLEV